MVELLGLEAKLRTVNIGQQLALALYLYSNPVYSIIYSIIGPYKNYLNWPRTTIYKRFNKAMSQFWIKVEHRFVIH